MSSLARRIQTKAWRSKTRPSPIMKVSLVDRRDNRGGSAWPLQPGDKTRLWHPDWIMRNRGALS